MNCINWPSAQDCPQDGLEAFTTVAHALLLLHDTSAGLPLNNLGAPNGRPNLPSRGKNTIDDDTFFDSLGQLLAQVG